MLIFELFMLSTYDGGLLLIFDLFMLIMNDVYMYIYICICVYILTIYQYLVSVVRSLSCECCNDRDVWVDIVDDLSPDRLTLVVGGFAVLLNV